MTHRYFAPSLVLASLFAAALPAQAQTGMEAFNPMAMLVPMMTPLGAMMVPMTAPAAAPMGNPMNAFNPAALFNPATQFNPAALFNPAMLPAMPAMPASAAPAGMVPFTGLQAMPQAYGMPPQMANPVANPFAGYPMLPFAMPGQPNPSAYPQFPGFPMPFPGSR